MQQVDKVLVFDIWGDLAHFRKIETTTSPLTYPIPTGTALTGIISAILGFERNSYYELFSPKNIRLAMRLLHPVKKVRININLIKTDEGFWLQDIKESPRRAPTPFEFIKEPKYRIYIWLNDKGLHEKLKDFLQYHKSYYTPYLGISGLIANFDFIGEFDAVQWVKDEEYIHTVVREDISKLIIEEGKRYAKERIPLFMDSNRIVQKYVDVFFEANANSLKIKDISFYKIAEENVLFL